MSPPEQTIDPQQINTVNPKDLSLENWKTFPKEELQTIAESHGFRNTQHLSLITLASMLYEFYSSATDLTIELQTTTTTDDSPLQQQHQLTTKILKILYIRHQH